MAIDAQELLQEDVATFDGHIVEALMKTPEINAMYPERKLFAIGWVKHKCKPGSKWTEIQAELRNWKKRQDAERKETGKYTSVVDLARARVNRQSTQPAESILSLPPFVANTSRHGKRWMKNWPTLCGLAILIPATLTAASIAGQKMKLSTKIAKQTGSAFPHQCANNPMPFATTVRLFLALSVSVRSTFTKDPVALNKYITEYLATKGVFEDEEADQSVVDVLQSSASQTDAVGNLST